ncbi:MAG: hypothetical protein ACOYLB_08860 [Phototrophicaceae bacterium]
MAKTPQSLLQSPNPAERQQGIKLLAQQTSRTAYETLIQVYKTDTDPATKELARRGALYIRQNAQKRQTASNPVVDSKDAPPAPSRGANSLLRSSATSPKSPIAKPSSSSLAEVKMGDFDIPDEQPVAPPTPPPAPVTPPKSQDPQPQEVVTFAPFEDPWDGEDWNKRIPVTAQKEKQASGLVESAMSAYYSESDEATALELLHKALELNPNLRKDSFFSSLTSSLFEGVEMRESVRMLRNKKIRDYYINLYRGAESSKENQAFEAEYTKHTWSSVGIGLGVLFLLTAVGIFGVATLVLGGGDNLVQNLMELDPISASLVSQLLAVLDNTFVILVTLVGTINVVAGVLATALGAHLIARGMLGGKSPLPYLVHNLSTMLTVRTAIGYGLALLCVGGGTYLEIPLTYAMIPLAIFIPLLQIEMFFRTIGKINLTYRFGMLKAFIAFLIGGIISGILSGIVSALTTPLLGGYSARIAEIATQFTQTFSSSSF